MKLDQALVAGLMTLAKLKLRVQVRSIDGT